jgi:hypothetical protein
MKGKNEVINQMIVALMELESNPPEHIERYLRTRLQTLCDILDDDLPEEYFDRLENYITL